MLEFIRMDILIHVGFKKKKKKEGAIFTYYCWGIERVTLTVDCTDSGTKCTIWSVECT